MEENVWVSVCKECRTEYPNHTVSCKYHPKNERIVGTHQDNGCGGNIIKKGEHSWCDKCREYFCGCATS